MLNKAWNKYHIKANYKTMSAHECLLESQSWFYIRNGTHADVQN